MRVPAAFAKVEPLPVVILKRVVEMGRNIINASVPKTAVQAIDDYFAKTCSTAEPLMVFRGDSGWHRASH